MIKESPKQIVNKLPPKKLLPDAQLLKNARINPVLATKSELTLPDTIKRPNSIENINLRRSLAGSLIQLKVEK